MGQTRTCKSGAALRKALTDLLEGERGQRLLATARSLCRNEAEAADLVSEACYRVLKAQARYDPARSLVGWLRRIMMNVFFDGRRKASRLLSLDAGSEYGRSLHEVLADSSDSVGERIEKEERCRALRAAVAALPKESRRIVKLCVFQDKTYEQAARQMGVPIGTIRSRLWRARVRLAMSKPLAALDVVGAYPQGYAR